MTDRGCWECYPYECGSMYQIRKIIIISERMSDGALVQVLGAGYTGLTTAAELALRGYRVRVVARDFGFQPPLTIVGTQSRRWPGSATSNALFDNDDLLDRELATIQRFLPLSSNPDSGVAVVPALKVSREPGNTWNRRPIGDAARLSASTAMQRSLRMATGGGATGDEHTVPVETVERFKSAGYCTVSSL